MRAKPWIIGAAVVAGILILGLGGWLFGLFQPDIPTAPQGGPTIELVQMPGSFDKPVQVVQGPEGLAIVEQGGKIRSIDGAVLLDLSTETRGSGERGLLAALWHGGAWYTHYTDNSGDTVLSRWDPDETVLWTHAQPYSNHNGGMIAIGPQGRLYLALGDGGLAADPDNNAQNTDTHLGGILRFELTGTGVQVPEDNPFKDGNAPYLFHYGLRNPWRFSFDRANMWIADVGQGNVEEVNFAAAGSSGLNFGWPQFEGSHRFRAGSAPGHVPPVAEYDHDDGCSITGGHVIRDGSNLDGAYTFGDYCSGKIWTITGGEMFLALDTDLSITSFGQGPDGEVYVVDHGGSWYRIQGSR